MAETHIMVIPSRCRECGVDMDIVMEHDISDPNPDPILRPVHPESDCVFVSSGRFNDWLIGVMNGKGHNLKKKLARLKRD